MNKTEKVAQDWLIANRGYALDNLTFSQRKSPDFVATDGSSFEVKLARNRTIYFGRNQARTLASTPNVTVLVFDVDGQFLDEFSASDLDGEPSISHGFRICYTDQSDHGTQINIDLEDSLYEEAKEAAAKLGIPVAGLVRLLLLNHLKEIEFSTKREQPDPTGLAK